MLKEKTNQDLLKKAIIYDRTTEEFFIQKAIGWSLRQYSKTNPQWVEELMKELVLSNAFFSEFNNVPSISNAKSFLSIISPYSLAFAKYLLPSRCAKGLNTNSFINSSTHCGFVLL
jgi:hypothetical protein